MFTGSLLPTQTISSGGPPLCITYSHPDSASRNCVQKLKETHCSNGEMRIAKQPFKLSVKSRPQPTTIGGVFIPTKFRAFYRFLACDEEVSDKAGKYAGLIQNQYLIFLVGSMNEEVKTSCYVDSDRVVYV